MAASYKAILRGENTDGTRDVYILLIKDRQPKYISLGISVKPKDWNEDASLSKPLWVRSGNLAAPSHNNLIQKRLKVAAAWMASRPTMPSGEWRDAVKAGIDPDMMEADAQRKALSNDFLEFFAAEIDRRRLAGKIRTATRLTNILSKIKEFQGWQPATGGSAEVPPKPLTYNLLTPRYIADYRQWVVSVKGNKGQTPDKELSFIKTILRLAIDEGLMPTQKNPFANIKFKTPAARKTKLTEEEVVAFETTPLPALAGLQYARDTWMLQYFLYGTRVADALLLRWRDVSETQLTFQEQKTGKWKSVERHDRLNAVLERLRRAAVNQYNREVVPTDFVVPLLSGTVWYTQYPASWSIADLEASKQYRKEYEALLSRLQSCTAKINYYLKSVAHHAGIEKHITSHVARHSFTAMARRAGVNAFDLRDMLSHHSVTLTEIYAGELEKDELATRAHDLYKRGAK